MSDLPPGWCECTMDDLSSYITSGSRDWSRYYADAGALFIRTQDINTNRLCDVDEIARVELPQTVEGKRTLVQKNDLLITITGANVGKCAYVQGDLPEAYVSQSVALVRLSDPNLAAFLQRQLIAPLEAGDKTALQSSAYGLGRPVLSLDNVRHIPIRLPPLAEQRRIVAKLDQVMARTARARAELARIPALIAHYKRATLTAVFDPPEGKRSPVPLHSVVETVSGFAFASGDYSIDGDIPLIRIGDIQNGSVEWSEGTQRLPTKFLRDFPDFQARTNDVLIALSGATTGKTGVYKHNEPALINQRVACLRARSKRGADQQYIALLCEWLTPQILEGAQGGAQPNISPKKIAGAVISWPNEAEREQIVRRITAAFTWLGKVSHEHAQATRLLDHLDQALLAKAFRGELIPQDPADEPAAKLLARIRAEREGESGRMKPKRSPKRASA